METRQERREKKLREIRSAMQSPNWNALREEIEGKVEAIKEMLVDPELSEKWRDTFVGCIMAYRYVLYLDEEASNVKTKQEKKNAR